MPPVWTLLLGLWALLIVIGLWLRPVMIRGDSDPLAAFCVRVFQIHARLFHNLTITGSAHAESARCALASGRPVIVAPNHTAGIDPTLIMSGLRFEPRWMMAADMRAPVLEPLWSFARIIFVDRSKRDASSLRTALRHLDEGMALGVFPEGHIERPPKHLLPFKDGIGLLVRKSGALVLPVVVDGTPQVDPAWASLWVRSDSTVRFLEPVDYRALGISTPAAITADLQERFARATGWPVSLRTPLIGDGLRLLVDVEGRYYDEATGRVLEDDQALALAEQAGIIEAGEISTGQGA